MKENRVVANNGSSIVLYTADDGNTQLEVKLEKDIMLKVVVNLINKDNQ